MLQGEMDPSASAALPAAAEHAELLLVTATTAITNVSIYIYLNNHRFRVMLK